MGMGKRFLCMDCNKETDNRRYCNECKKKRMIKRKMLKEMNKIRGEILG